MQRPRIYIITLCFALFSGRVLSGCFRKQRDFKAQLIQEEDRTIPGKFILLEPGTSRTRNDSRDPWDVNILRDKLHTVP